MQELAIIIYTFIKPSAHARSEGYCSCPLCMYICVCVRSNLPPHTLESQKKRYPRIHRNTGTRQFLIFADFAKNSSFKGYGVICSLRAAPAS